MKAKPTPSQDFLNSILQYDAETGELRWRERAAQSFYRLPVKLAQRAAKMWNTSHAGNLALTHLKPDGYLGGKIDGGHYLAHRIIWKMMTGADADQVDHINGSRDNNRFSNLRGVGQAENGKNQRISRRNTSGTPGVTYRKTDRTWEARIISGGKRIHLGVFHAKNDAISARKAAEKIYGFHENHGRLS